MKYLVEREKKEIVLAEGLTLAFIRREDDETYIDKMPGSRRILSVADGNVIVSHEGESVENAKAGSSVVIEGEKSTKVFGKFHGVCLSAKDDIVWSAETVDINKDRKALKLPEDAGNGDFVQVITAGGGYAVVTLGNDSLMLEKGETLAVSCTDAEYDIGVMGEGRIIAGTFACAGTFEGAAPSAGEEAAGDTDKAEAVKDKAKKLIKDRKSKRNKVSLKGATMKDFINAFRVSATSNSILRHISSFRKNNWLDPEITWEIDKLQRKHINAIIWLVVLCVIMAIVGVGSKFSGFFIWAVLWTLADFFIVAPFVYLLIMPKPTTKHIKKITDLTDEEKKIRQKEIDSDKVPHKKRVLKRF